MSTSSPPKKKKLGPHARAKRRAAREAANADVLDAAIASRDPIELAKALQAISPRSPTIVAPAPRPVVELPSAPPASLSMMGPPPEDPLAANAWAHRVTMLAMHDAAIDPELSPRERRKEIRTLAASGAKLTPSARMWEALVEIRADRAELDAKAASKRGAVLEPRPPRSPKIVEH